MTNRLTDPQSLVAKWAGRHADKEALRHEIWAKLEQTSAAVGNPWHRIPVFVGGEKAAARLAELPAGGTPHLDQCQSAELQPGYRPGSSPAAGIGSGQADPDLYAGSSPDP